MACQLGYGGRARCARAAQVKLVYTQDAVDDLNRLREFIAVHNPAAARRVAAELVDKIASLTEFPQRGVPVLLAPAPATIRDLVFSRYVIRYSVHPETLIILRIWHQLEGER